MMAINIDTDTITVEQFKALCPIDKGYVVYMCGCRKDQPNVPEEYEPAPEDAGEYASGQHIAIIQVQDNP